MTVERQHWQWVQLNTGLIRQQFQALPSARQLFDDLVPLVHQWRSEEKLQYFFFMRKPPDLRIRFFVSDPNRLMVHLNELINRLQQRHIISNYFFSLYQPEYDRFGGEKVMPLVHHYFDIDTTQWLRLDHLRKQEKTSISTETLLGNVFEHLFQTVLTSAQEVLDTWHKLKNIYSETAGEIESSLLTQSLFSLEGDCTKGSRDTPEYLVLNQYFEANIELSQRLQSLGQTLLSRNRVEILANLSQFTLHRHGFDAQHAKLLIDKVLYSKKYFEQQVPRVGIPSAS